MQAAFFQQAWFWIACAVCALMVIYLGVKMRLRILQDRERLLARRVEEQTAQLSAAKEAAEGAAEMITQLSRGKRLILDSTAEGIFGLDRDGVATFINPSAARLLGWSVEELAGRDLHSLIHSADGLPPPNRESCVICSSTLEPRTRIGRDVFFRRDGRSFPVDYTVSAIVDECGTSEGVVVTFRDITEQLCIERMKDEFISTVSHELRTPLTSIRGALGLLQSGMLGTMATRGQRMLDVAVANTDRLVRLINDILDLERIGSGRLELLLRDADAYDLMTVAVDGVRTMADQAGIEVLVEPTGGMVRVDSDRIIQTLTNLVSNAIKFSPSGTRVVVSGEPCDHEFVFCVADQGRGIPVEMLESIFERFKQVDASDSRQKGGTGLGLSICQSIVHAHGGRIWAESGDSGSVFRFSIPASPQCRVLSDAGAGFSDALAASVHDKGGDPCMTSFSA
jgi:PAS domain S-box-containing protein